jgi:hypothetical protein
MKRLKNPLIIIVAVAILASLTANAVLYTKYKKAQDNNPDVQTSRIVAELEKSIDLPNEQPSVLTVVDKSKLTDSEIAKKAENGDKILLFQKAGQVIIYRPETKKLVNILNLTTNKTGGTTQDTSATPQGATNDAQAKPAQ